MVVIKYYTTFLGMTNPTYEIVEDPTKRGKVVPKEHAISTIKKLGLVKSYRDENGIVWDTPDQEFYWSFKGMGQKIKEV